MCRENGRRLRFGPGLEFSSRYLKLRSTSHRAVSCTCTSLLDSPDPAGAGIGRARLVSWWLTQISFFANFPFRNVKCGAVRKKTLNFPLEQEGSYTASSSVPVRPSLELKGVVELDSPSLPVGVDAREIPLAKLDLGGWAWWRLGRGF